MNLNQYQYLDLRLCSDLNLYLRPSLNLQRILDLKMIALPIKAAHRNQTSLNLNLDLRLDANPTLTFCLDQKPNQLMNLNQYQMLRKHQGLNPSLKLTLHLRPYQDVDQNWNQNLRPCWDLNLYFILRPSLNLQRILDLKMINLPIKASHRNQRHNQNTNPTLELDQKPNQFMNLNQYQYLDLRLCSDLNLYLRPSVNLQSFLNLKVIALPIKVAFQTPLNLSLNQRRCPNTNPTLNWYLGQKPNQFMNLDQYQMLRHHLGLNPTLNLNLHLRPYQDLDQNWNQNLTPCWDLNPYLILRPSLNLQRVLDLKMISLLIRVMKREDGPI
ncbi:uncharacterized protein LOC103152965 isoform X6 [Poecilia formosa]|uniref:uncharacterized protein LOC103152965 isoform X6 n=1 Tax=Poecilia formosa TaxID=48698 RepID=UPI0004438337|nr:PREDICTED: uncharacterized protein LOC103152965 isoform X6 [Poecilia formosa]